MGNARCIVSADEKDQVAGSCVGRGYRGGNIIESLGSQPARVADAALRQHPGHEAGAIKRSVRIAAAPDIGISTFFKSQLKKLQQKTYNRYAYTYNIHIL